MTNITNEFMQQMIGTAGVYTAVILKAGPNIEWRAPGQFPVADGSDTKDIDLFNADEARQKRSWAGIRV